MKLANEAGYLYVYSKQLMYINKKIKKLSAKAEKHAVKHMKANTEKKKQKHREKHARVKINIENLLKKHNKIVKILRHHNVAFYHALAKEHKI